MTVLVTSEREFAQASQRIGDMLRAERGARLANPFKLWVLDPPRAPGSSAQLDYERNREQTR